MGLWLFGLLDTVFTARLCTTSDSTKVQGTTYEFVTHTWQILRPSTSDQNHTMLLEIVALALDVGHEGFTRRQLDPRDLSLGRVGFLGRLDEQTGDDALLLWAGLEQGRADVCGLLRGAFGAHGLVDGALRCGGRVEGPLLLLCEGFL